MRDENTLQNVVSHFLLEAGYGDAEYTRAYHIASRGLRELSIDLPLGHEYVAELPVEPNGTVVIPEDCVKVLGVKRLLNGKEVALTMNPYLSKLDSSASAVNGSEVRMGTSPDWRGGSLGVGSYSNYGEYHISGNLIYLSSSIGHGCSIVIEYKAFPETETEEPYVHPYVREALIAYLRWMFSINRKNQDKWDKQYFEKEYHRLKRNSRSRIKGMTRQEMNQSARQHTKGGLKS